MREVPYVTPPSDQLDPPDQRPSFLARRSLGPPNYFLLAMAVAFLIAFMPRGVRKAIESNTNKAEDWLPANYSESIDLRWFRDHFIGEQFVLVSWDGCTLGDTERLQWLVKKLSPSSEALTKAPPESDLHLRAAWYKHITTGPDVLEQLVSPPLSLDYGEALRRIEGALVGPIRRDAEGRSLGNESRITCLIVYLSEEATRDNKTMRRAVEAIAHIADTECGIPQQNIRMGGPPVDNITIDIEGERTLVRLAALSGIVGLSLSYWCFRSIKVTIIVFSVGVLAAGMSLAIVFYFGVIEVMVFGAERPRLGTVDAILMSMPAVVYVLGLSGAIHIVNYYRDARREHGLKGAAERAVRLGWVPCTLAACTTAVGLGSLYISDILPIKKFGLFTAIAVMGTVVILFTILPVFLHRFPPSDALIRRQSKGGHDAGHLPNWALALFGFVVRRHVIVAIFWMVMMGTFAFGFTKIGTSVQLLKLLDPDTKLIHDYAWLERNLGNLVPMEVVLTMPPERLRTADEHAEENGNQYRMTMVERLDMMRQIQNRIEEFPEISRVLSVATFTPPATTTGIGGADRSADYAKNRSLEENRELLLDGDYLRMERDAKTGKETGRELWRVSARVAALGADNDPTGPVIDYGQFVQDLRSAVDPILIAYQQRDMIVERLHAEGKRIDGSQLTILYRSPEATTEPVHTWQEQVLGNLLRKSGVQSRRVGAGTVQGISFYNLRELESHRDDPEYVERALRNLGTRAALILVSAASDPIAKWLADEELLVIDVTHVPGFEASAAFALEKDSASRPVRAVYTGMVPLVYKTQRQLLNSLEQSIFCATLLIAVIMMFVLRSPMAGLISMIPNVFPIVMIFGALGWLGIKVDIGIMMSASVALGVAVDDTIHFLTWFRRGAAIGLDRVQSVMLAYDRCATAMLQTTIIGGLGLAVFATSTFTPTQQFGYLMISMLGAALVGDLLMFPAILVSPIGRFFGAKAPEKSIGDLCMRGAYVEAKQQHVESLQEGGVAEPATAESTGRPPADRPPARDPGELARPAASQEAEVPKPHQPRPGEKHQPATATENRTSTRPKSKDDPKEVVAGPHSALHAKLRSLRRDSSDSVSS